MLYCSEQLVDFKYAGVINVITRLQLVIVSYSCSCHDSYMSSSCNDENTLMFVLFFFKHSIINSLRFLSSSQYDK